LVAAFLPPSVLRKVHLKRFLVIAAIVVVAVLACWRIAASRVDRSKPDQVATAFVAALKANDLDKASGYWVPDAAEAWHTSAAGKLDQMQSQTSTDFFESLSTNSNFVSSHDAKSPANEQTLTNGATHLDLRQIDNKWYVCKGPV
jgi:hypothetical protein